MLRGELIETPEVPRAIRDAWDALAVARGRPFSSPSWMLSWWRHARPRGAVLRIVTVQEEGALAGIIPLFAQRNASGSTRYRLLASPTSAHVEPLVLSGSERAVAAAAASVLASDATGPFVVSLHGLSVSSPWPALFETAWPGGPAWVHRGPGMPAPRLTLEGRSYEGWFAGLSRHRRAELRRRRRRLEDLGAAARLVASPEEIPAALRAFSALHHERWRRRGGSGVLDRGVEAMLEDVATELVPSSRFRLWSIEVDGRPIGSCAFVAAGGCLSYWLGGFDERWGAYGPAIEIVRAALEHAWSVGDQVVDFGPGGQRYKYTFAEDEDVVRSVDLVPRVAGFRRARAALTPEYLWDRVLAFRYDAFRRLSPGAQQRLKAIRKRLARR